MDTIIVGLAALVFCLSTMWELRIMRRRLQALEAITMHLLDPEHHDICYHFKRQ